MNKSPKMLSFRSYALSLIWTFAPMNNFTKISYFRKYELSHLCTFARMNFRTYALSQVWTFARMHFRAYELSHLCTFARMNFRTYEHLHKNFSQLWTFARMSFAHMIRPPFFLWKYGKRRKAAHFCILMPWPLSGPLVYIRAKGCETAHQFLMWSKAEKWLIIL